MTGMEETLTAHQRQGSNSCLCGWAKLGHSHPAHVAEELGKAGFGPLKHAEGGIWTMTDTEFKNELGKAWDEGRQAGHDAMFGKHPTNPYRRSQP